MSVVDYRLCMSSVVIRECLPLLLLLEIEVIKLQSLCLRMCVDAGHTATLIRDGRRCSQGLGT